MIHKVDTGYVISNQGYGWIPGVYADRKAARYAFQFPDEELQKLQEKLRPVRITSDDLKQLRKDLK